jgi:hypothetical protein
VKPGYPQVLPNEIGYKIDFGLKRMTININRAITHSHLGVATAIEANLAAIWHVQIDRNALASIELA